MGSVCTGYLASLRPSPLGAGKFEDVFDREIAFEFAEHRGFDLGFVALAGEGVLSELEVLKHEFGVAEQVVDGRAQGVREGDQHGAPGRGFVAFVLPDGLGRDQAVDGRREVAQR